MVNSTPDRNSAAFHVFDDDRVSADPGAGSDLNWSQDLGACADVYMVSNPGESTPISSADRNLLEDQAIHSDPSVGMNYDTIWMRNEKAAADIAVKGDIGTCDGAPKTVTNDKRP